MDIRRELGQLDMEVQVLLPRASGWPVRTLLPVGAWGGLEGLTVGLRAWVAI